MKIILFITAFLSIHFYATAQFSQNEEKQIVVGAVDSLFSEILNEQRELWVHLPEKIEDGKKYPVIYVLDAPDHFYAVTGILKLLERWNLPKSIVVGIPNTDRNRDFTPTNVPFQRGHKSETSGGAPNFIKFIENELKPYVKSKYPTDTMSTVIGHSTGGLFVLYAYMHHPEVFDNYLAIDPSLWWDKEKLVNQSKEIFNRSTRQNKSLYVAVANSTGIDTTKVRRLKSEPTEMLRANLHFHDILVKNKGQLDFTWDYQGDEDHGSVVLPGMYNGLRSLFLWYPFPERWRFNTPKAYSAKQLTEPFYVHFEELSKRFKREVKPEWQFINDVGFFILTSHKLPKKAQAYLEMNLKYYPDESRSYVAMGDYYTKQKKKDEAIEYFEKAIKIDGNKEAQTKLNVLKEGK
ncbi:alpha/beta hydrolase-fold protein [Dokdonia sp.]|uniref:alpha/beta hydrolase-fold protein n=1 Tax=Dokdonia sp. TaxID=2024995 RepID=UPI0032679D86